MGRTEEVRTAREKLTGKGAVAMGIAALAVTAAALLLGAATPAQVTNLGQIDFPNSGAAEAQDDFLRGALLLHSFVYEDAAEAFQAARKIDPDFALAYWGEALTHYHPLWQQDDVDAARAVLNRLAPTSAERLAKAPTEREKGYLETVEILFAEGPRRQQHRAYSQALGLLSMRFPDDLEIASFYSLSILGTSYGMRDTATYMRAAGVAEEVYSRNPQHPGALHYLIHSYDDPVHAPLGLRQARTYAQVAPAAAHALHMPSHIYVALGMWDESASSNEDSSAAADARRERKGLGLDARGYHSLYWLAYTYQQQGRLEDARKLLVQMQKDAAESGSERTRYHLVSMKATHFVSTSGNEAGDIEVDLADLGLQIAGADRLVEGMASASKGDFETARGLLATMRTAREEVVATESAEHFGCQPGDNTYGATDPPGRQAAYVMEKELEGFIQLKEGKTEAAVATLQQAADLEDAMGFDFGPPTVVKPAHELLGEALMELGRSEEAAEQFGLALNRAPRRSFSLLGLARASAATGDSDAATRTYAELASIWHRADADYAHVAEAKRGASAPAYARKN